MYIRQSHSDNISIQLFKIDINNRHSFKNKILFGNNLKNEHARRFSIWYFQRLLSIRHCYSENDYKMALPPVSTSIRARK